MRLLAGGDIRLMPCYMSDRLPLWTSGQSSWLHIQRSWVRLPELPDFLRSSESRTGPLSPVRITEELLE
jgi:hypothetical protein